MSDQTLPRKNIARRSIGVLLGLLPVLLLAASIIVGMQDAHFGPGSAMGFMIAAGLIAIVNFYLSFVRGWLHVKRHGSSDGYRHVSGFPGIATILVIVGVLLGFGEISTALLGIGVMSIDTGGSVWFLFSTWRDRSFWDA